MHREKEKVGRRKTNKMPVEKFIESLERARALLHTADHLTYITFPFVKEKRMLLKILEELASSLISMINAVLQHEYYYKRIQLYRDAKDNFNKFKEIAPRYNISQREVEKIIEILSLTEKHKKSPLEFVKEDKIVIMADGFKVETLTIEKIKEFVLLTKELLKNVTLAVTGRE